MATPSPLGDSGDPGLRQFQAIVDTYAKGKIDHDECVELTPTSP